MGLAITHGTTGIDLAWHEPFVGLIVIPATVLLLVILWQQIVGRPIRAYGMLGYCGNFGIGIALFSFQETRFATALFAGASLLLAAARGYAGCEVLALSNWLLRRDDQVACTVLSSIDSAEAQSRGRRA